MTYFILFPPLQVSNGNPPFCFAIMFKRCEIQEQTNR